MAELAQVQLQRIVALVARMSQRDSERPLPYATAARQLGVSEATLKGDVQVLIDLTDRHKDWLASLSVAITAKGLLLESRGAFRRPLRLTRDEALALVVGLTGVAGGRGLALKLGTSFSAAPQSADVHRSWALGPSPGATVAETLSLGRQARDAGRKLDLFYCGSDGEPSRRTVQVHQVVQAGGVWYLVAWCERAGATRHFRAERIVEVALREEKFAPRPELKRVTGARELLVADRTPVATVAFSGRIARWMREKYPAGGLRPDGRYLVKLPVADPRWLAREVLQYGAEAEVLEPASMREVMKAMLG